MPVITLSTLANAAYPIQFPDPYGAAKAAGLECIEPKPNELFIDIDTKADEDWFNCMMPLIHSHWPKAETRTTPSKSGGDKLHIVLTVPDMRFSDAERIALQASLGSDRQRELLSILAAISRAPFPQTVFFERKTNG